MMSFPLENARSKVNGHHKYSEKKTQVLTMFGMNCSLTSLQKAILRKILNGLKLFFPNVSTNNKITSEIMNNSY